MSNNSSEGKKKQKKRDKKPEKVQSTAKKTVNQRAEERAELLKDNIVTMLSDPNMAGVLSGIDNTAAETGRPQVIHSSNPNVDYIIMTVNHP